MTEAMPRFQTGGNRRILVVEDEPITRRLFWGCFWIPFL